MADKPTPEQALAIYKNLRGIAFGCSLERSRLDPALFADGTVFGGIMEYSSASGSVTFFCCYEIGAAEYVHLALYTSSGFGIIGQNYPTAVFDLARRYLELLNRHKTTMKPVREFPLPGRNTRFYAFSNDQILSAEAKQKWRGGPGPLKPLENAASEVLLEMYKVIPDHHEVS
jgi:hypothetical protein